MSPYRPSSYYPPGAYAPRPGYDPAPPPAFQFADLIRIIENRRTLILRVTLGVMLCALAAAMVLPTVWSATATVMLDPRRNNVTELTAVLSQLTADPATVQNQLQIIQSRELASQVVDKLHLEQDPEFNPAYSRPSLLQLVGEMVSLMNPKNWADNDAPVTSAANRDRVVTNFLSHVSAAPEGTSTSIAISVTARDGTKAAQLANTLADTYVKSQLATKVGATTATTNWLNQRLSDLAQQLQVQQEAIQRYKAEHNLNDSAPGNSLVDQQMSAINTQIVAARADLAQKQAVKDRIDQLVAGGNPADVSQIVSSPLIVQLRTQQAQALRDEADLNSKYGPLHPKLQAAQQQKRDLDMKITQEVNRLAAGASNDVLVARTNLNSLQGSLGGTEGTARTQNMARIQLQAMESNANSTRTQYEAFVQRLRSTQNMDDVQVPDARIISPAAIPMGPAGPKRMLILFASVPLGLMLGLLSALVAEKIGPMFARTAPVEPTMTRRPQPARRALNPMRGEVSNPVTVWNGPPILAEVNDPAQLRAADFVLDYPASKYAHAMAGLVKQLESQHGGAAIVALTSADNGESRSAIAVSLTRAAARMGKKAILVDCAPGHMASRAMKTRIRSGLYEVLTGAVPLNKALAKDPRGEAYLLGTAKRAPNSVTMHGSEPMTHLVDVLRGGADFVVLDCGHGASPDAGLLARLADATVLVSRRAQLHSPLVVKATRALNEAHAAPIGIVVTK